MIFPTEQAYKVQTHMEEDLLPQCTWNTEYIPVITSSTGIKAGVKSRSYFHVRYL